MTARFSVRPSWFAANDNCPAEAKETYALLQILVGEQVLTRAIDEWSKTVRDEVLVSAYPLALWFASSWWRLRWESVPGELPDRRDLDWRMSHELPASGWGFIWPRIIFESDGENVDVRAVGTSISESEPVQYLENFHGTISGLDFEDGVDNFIRLVIARLEAVGIKVTDLQSTWQEVLRERADPERSQFRRLEASLGFDIDDAPEATIHKYIETAKVAGESAAGEIAAALAAIHKQEEVLSLDEIAKTEGLQGRFNLPSIKALDDMGHAGPPWERGRRLADSLRSRLGLDGRIVEDELLSELLGVPAMEVTDSDRDRAVPLIGFAVRNGGGSSKLFFRKRNRPGRRFEAARFISDTMFAPAEDRWLPATDSKTARQKMQRAFAAEFLCPKDSLLQFLDGDFADEKMDEAGEHFGVSSLAVKNHLANHGIVEFGPA